MRATRVIAMGRRIDVTCDKLSDEFRRVPWSCMGGCGVRSIWSKMATLPINRQSAKGLSGSPGRMDDREDHLMRSTSFSRDPTHSLNSSPSTKEVRRVRHLVALISSANSRKHGYHPKGGRHPRAMLRRGMTHEELMSLLDAYVDDPKYGRRVKAFLARRRRRILPSLSE